MRRAALAFAREVERRVPEDVTTTWWRKDRDPTKVFIDFNQNARDHTIRPTRSGRDSDSATDRALQLNGNLPVPADRSSQASALQAGSRYASIRSSKLLPINLAKHARMLRVNGSAKLIWNTNGRQDT